LNTSARGRSPKTPLFRAALLACFLLTALPVTAQNLTHVPAPPAGEAPIRIASTRIGDKYLKIVYGSPVTDNADVIGSDVPYGDVWAPGEGPVAEFTVTAATMVAGSHIEAGTYALYIIPEAARWTFVFNNRLGLSTSDAYDAAGDVLRAQVPARRTTRHHEALTFELEAGEHAAGLLVKWGRAEVILPIMVH